MSAPQNPAGTIVWSSYVDFDEAWQHIDMDNPPQGAKARKLQRYIDAACGEAQNIANRPLTPMLFCERHDGWSGEYILLRYSPFLQLVNCTEWQSSGGPVVLTESTPENPVEGVQIDYGTSKLMRTFAGYSWPRPFFPGSRNISVEYIAGFNPTPPDIMLATLELIEWWWRSTQEEARWTGQAQMVFDQPQQSSGQQWAGLPGIPPRIAATFEKYWLPQIG